MSAMAMTVFIVIETEDIEIVSATPYMDRALADEAFETLAGEYMLQEYETGELEREAPGLVHAMLAFGLGKTPMAALSRYCAGTRGRALVINMPGSPKAVRECVEALRLLLPHALALIGGE